MNRFLKRLQSALRNLGRPPKPPVKPPREPGGVKLTPGQLPPVEPPREPTEEEIERYAKKGIEYVGRANPSQFNGVGLRKGRGMATHFLDAVEYAGEIPIPTQIFRRPDGKFQVYVILTPDGDTP